MREIKVSTAVFASIWANRRDEEETEDEILQRLLLDRASSVNLSDSIIQEENSDNKIDGVLDRRNNVHFLEGMRISRSYKGNEYTAVASSGLWVREDTQQKYPTLNQLNTSITEGPENVWNGNWRFVDSGISRSINLLRKRKRAIF